MMTKIKTPYDFVEEPAVELTEQLFDKEAFTNWFNDTITHLYNKLDDSDRSIENIPKEFKVDYHDIPNVYWRLIKDKPFKGNMCIAVVQPFWEALHRGGWDMRRKLEGDMVIFVYKGKRKWLLQ